MLCFIHFFFAFVLFSGRYFYYIFLYAGAVITTEFRVNMLGKVVYFFLWLKSVVFSISRVNGKLWQKQVAENG